ncbi:MAG: hypothetical protein ACI9HU_000625 [Colwellia sp.]
MKLISKIAYIHVEIQELVHESKLTALNKLLDESTNLYGERIAELEKTVKSLTNAVSLFRQDNYDTQPLIIAYKEALKEQGK